MIDKTLPGATDDTGDAVDIVKWCNHPYPTAHKRTMWVLSIFHGPTVESSFRAMVDAIYKKGNRICDRHLNCEVLYADSMSKFQLFPKQPAL